MTSEKNSPRLGLIGLVLANLVPVIGVLYWQWSLPAILVLYWMESFVIGAFNVPKILMARGSLGRNFGTTVFFIIHYGGFWLGHALFLFTFLLPRVEEAALGSGGMVNAGFGNLSIYWALLFFAVSHLFSFLFNFIGRKEYGKLPATAQMFMPYGRVFVMHIVILGGAALLSSYANILPVLLLFIALKTVFDGASHIFTHGVYGTKTQTGL